MTPSQVKTKAFPPKRKVANFFWMFRTFSGLVLSKNSIVISLVQVPCSFYWTILAVALATLLKRDPRTGVSEPAVCGSSTKQCSRIIVFTGKHLSCSLFLNQVQKQTFTDVLQSNCSLFLKSLQTSQESTCVGVFFNKVAGPQNCKFIKKRLHHRFFPENFVNYSRTPILQRIYERLALKNQCAFLGTPFFKEHLQWLRLTVSDFQSATLSLLKETPAKMFICEFCKMFKSILQNTSASLHL